MWYAIAVRAWNPLVKTCGLDHLLKISVWCVTLKAWYANSQFKINVVNLKNSCGNSSEKISLKLDFYSSMKKDYSWVRHVVDVYIYELSISLHEKKMLFAGSIGSLSTTVSGQCNSYQPQSM